MNPADPVKPARPPAEAASTPVGADHNTPGGEKTGPFIPVGSNPALALGVLAGRYHLHERLGRGGFGEVYRATDNRLDREVAVKMLLPEVAAVEENRLRFVREARATAKLREHDHVVPVYDFGEEAGTPFLVMPVLRGETLDKPLGRKELPTTAHAITIARQVAEALAAAHAKDMVHRDVKPSNIWLEANADGSFRRVRLLDFGLTFGTGFQDNIAPTQAGAWKGTPPYMSPEQIECTADARSDLWSLGVVLYEMLCGQRPFAGESLMKLFFAISMTPHRPVSEINTLLSTELCRLVSHLLAKDREGRPQAAKQVVEALGQIIVTRSATDRVADEPTEFAEFHLVRLMSRWDFEVNYQARPKRPNDNRSVYLKVFGPELPWTDIARTRLKRELDRVRAVTHQSSILPVETFGVSPTGIPYLTIPWHNGWTFRTIRGTGKQMLAGQYVRTCQLAAASLATVHRGGLIHSCLALGNFCVEFRGPGVHTIRISEAGIYPAYRKIVPLIDADFDSHQHHIYFDSIAPEQTAGETATPASDVFSLGSVLFTAITGQVPYRVGKLLVFTDFEKTPNRVFSVRRFVPAIPQKASALLTRMIDIHPERRPTSEEVADTFAQVESTA